MAQYMTTDEVAAALHVRSQTIRAALCRAGHYYGIRPTKLPNRFLLWPADAVQQLIERSRRDAV